MNQKKIYILQSHPIQYFSPFYRAMFLKLPGNFKVFYCSDSSVKGYYDKGFGTNVKWDVPLLDGYPYQFIKNYALHPATHNKLFNQINPGIARIILKDKPDILWVHGWSYFTIWMALIACKLSGTKIWMKCETPLNQELKKLGHVKLIKRVVIQFFLFKMIDKFLYIGTQNKLFYQHYGVPDHKLIFTPYAVENSRFYESFQMLRPQRNKLREDLKISVNHTVILFSGKLIPKKRPMDLLEAFIKLKQTNVTLLFLGDGELRSTMEARVKAAPAENVIITGFVNQAEISVYYAISDIFVLPSDIGETWGLVVNEAMNFGLPVLISDIPGSGYDLVKDGVNGYTYPVGDINKLSERLSELHMNPEIRQKFGTASLELIKQYNYELSIMEISKNLVPNS